MSAVDSGLTIEPPDLRERWRWLDGPAPFATPTTLEALAMRLVDRERTPLSYGEWACVLQWHDNPAELGEKEGPGTVRHYELAFLGPQPGAATRRRASDPWTLSSNPLSLRGVIPRLIAQRCSASSPEC